MTFLQIQTQKAHIAQQMRKEPNILEVNMQEKVNHIIGVIVGMMDGTIMNDLLII